MTLHEFHPIPELNAFFSVPMVYKCSRCDIICHPIDKLENTYDYKHTDCNACIISLSKYVSSIGLHEFQQIISCDLNFTTFECIKCGERLICSINKVTSLKSINENAYLFGDCNLKILKRVHES